MAEFHPIATMRSAFPTKFGIPRQSGLVTELKSTIVFEPPYRNPEMLRGIEGFSHLWLIWSFSQSGDHWSPTVRPPRLGATSGWGSSPPAPPSDPTTSACPRCAWSGWRCTHRKGRCSMCPERT